MKKGILLFFALALLLPLMAQRPAYGGYGKKKNTGIKGKIEGQITDSLSRGVVSFATVVLLNPLDNKQVNGTITDEDGKFKLEGVTTGKYNIELSFIGYENKILKGVETTPKKPDLDLETILIAPSSTLLEEVTVVGEASLIENKIDKLVYNAEKDATNSGGDASDVLRKVPLLSVDLEGNVSLRGSTNIRILINGKPSGMFSTSVADALKTIPSDQIKSVEVITAPSAKYDGEGSAGIVNIITKRKNIEGFSGSVNGSLGTRQNNAGLNLAAAKGRFGINLNGATYFSWKRPGNFDFYRQSSSDLGMTTLEQNGVSNTSRIGFNGGASAYYDINAYNSINSSFRLNGYAFDNDGTTMSSFISPTLTQDYTRLTDGGNLYSGYDWSTDYTKKFVKPEQEFTLAFQMNGNVNDRDNLVIQNSDDESLQIDEKQINDGKNLEFTFQADYVHPFSDKLKMEIGAKSIIRNIDSDFRYAPFDFNSNDYQRDPLRSDIFDYRQDVYSGYVSFNIKLGEKYGANIGVRYEQTDIKGVYDSETPPFSNNYANWLPSIILSRKLNDFSSLKLSYTKRIQRPSLYYINPFTDRSDPRNVTFGNPELLPEQTNQIELAYNTYIKGLVLNISTYYKLTTDLIESNLQVNDEGVSETTFRNIGENNSYGLNLFTQKTLFKIWSIRGGLNLYTYDVNSDFTTKETFAVLAGWNYGTSVKLKHDIKLELFGFGRSPRQTLQGQNPSFTFISFGAEKAIWNKKGSIGIRIVEPWQRDKSFATDLEGVGFVQRSNFTIPFQSFGINFKYRFGKLDFKARKSNIKNDDVKEGEGNNF